MAAPTLDQVQADPDFKALSTPEKYHVLEQLGLAGAPPAVGTPGTGEEGASPSTARTLGLTGLRVAGPLAGARYGTPGMALGTMISEGLARKAEGKSFDPSEVAKAGELALLLGGASRLPGAIGRVVGSKLGLGKPNPAASIPATALEKATQEAASNEGLDPSGITKFARAAQSRVEPSAPDAAPTIPINQAEAIRTRNPLNGPTADRLYKAQWDDIRQGVASGDPEAAKLAKLLQSYRAVHTAGEAIPTTPGQIMADTALGGTSAYVTHSPYAALAGLIPSLLKLIKAAYVAPDAPYLGAALTGGAQSARQ